MVYTTKFSTLFNLQKESVPFINSDISIDRISKDNFCMEGDIVFADASEDVKDVGKSIEIINLNNEKLLAGLHTFLARQIVPKLVIGFGAYLFKSSSIRTQIKRESQGSKVLGISKGRLSDISIYFPQNKSEQQKIASCLSSLDEVIAAHIQKLDTLKAHKKGLMQNLFPTNSITNVPNYRFPEFLKDGEWVEKKLGEVAELTSSKRIHLADYVPSGIPFYRGKEISQLKNNNIIEDILYISEEQYKSIKEKYGVPKIGDILITAVGTLGNIYCIKSNKKFYFKDGNLIWMKNITLDSVFLEVLLDVEKEKVLASAIGSSQKALTMAALNKLEFNVPKNPKEQQKIASCLSSLDDLITAQMEKIAQLKLHKKGLMEGLFPRSITN
jgi:type I restriction enzyme S subunit